MRDKILMGQSQQKISLGRLWYRLEGGDNIKIQNFIKTSYQSTNWAHLDQDRTH